MIDLEFQVTKLPSLRTRTLSDLSTFCMSLGRAQYTMATTLQINGPQEHHQPPAYIPKDIVLIDSHMRPPEGKSKKNLRNQNILVQKQLRLEGERFCFWNT